MDDGEVTLRPLEVSDIDHFMIWATDDQVSRYCVWNTYTSKEDGIKYIESLSSHPWQRAICLNGKPIGAIAVEPNTGPDACRAQVGYVLAAEYWGKGIVTIVVKMVCDQIFREWLHLERLEALVDVDNLRSQRVLEKAGFLKEGVLRKYSALKGRIRDIAMFSFLRADISG
ncbi:unnamed protein product [Rhodiola kirilowii]